MIWGLKTVAFIDIWTFEHFLSGISIGMVIMSIHSRYLYSQLKIATETRKTSYMDIVAVLLLAYMWEALEHYLEAGLVGKTVTYWFQGVEFWGNRLICDPLVTVAGYYLAKQHAFLVQPARVISLLWLLVHVFVFPHSMYLHEVF